KKKQGAFLEFSVSIRSLFWKDCANTDARQFDFSGSNDELMITLSSVNIITIFRFKHRYIVNRKLENLALNSVIDPLTSIYLMRNTRESLGMTPTNRFATDRLIDAAFQICIKTRHYESYHYNLSKEIWKWNLII
ncbi:12703_t:CDS:2, partial [Funneliformis caledonium]